jgi:aspartate racemase
VKRIGLLGGMSWESSAEYYRLANETVRNRRGGLHSARCQMYSVDFAPIERMQAEGRWEDARACWLTPLGHCRPAARIS